MVVSTFFMLDKDGKERVFEEGFLLADVNLNVMLEMSFLTMNNANVDFQARNLQWRSYTTRNVLPTTRRVELIEKKKFAAATLDLEYEAFIVYIAVFSIDLGDKVHLFDEG